MNSIKATTQNDLVIGCVTEPVAKYLQQAARLLLSLRWFGGKIANAPFILCTTGELSTGTEAFFAKYGAQIILIDRFSEDHGPSNKLRFFELGLLDEYEHILLLDCDTIIVRDPSQFLETTGLSLKIADVPTVTTEELRELFLAFSLTIPAEKFEHDIRGGACMPYFNSGVILLNVTWREKFVSAWSHYNRLLIEKKESLNFNSFYTDQISLTLAINAISIPITPLPSTMNLAGHLLANRYPPRFFTIDPFIIHYHGLFDENGYITKTPLDQANRRIDSFNTRLRAQKMSSQAPISISAPRPENMSPAYTPKIVVGSGWWCDDNESAWDIGCKATRSIPFFSLWLTQVVKCLSPHRIIITDSHSPLKPDYKAYDLIQWVELDKNYGHANDIRIKMINTKYSGFTRSVLQGCLYALSCDADYYIYVEQDCLLKGENFLKLAVGNNEEDILIGQATKGGIGLGGKTAASMKQQSLMIIKKSAMERLITGLLEADWSDGEVSPEITMERQLKSLGTLAIPFGRSRPIDFDQPCFYAQHFTIDELNQFIQLEDLEDTWAQLTEKYFFERL
jgi:hypothetical protein